jgi:CRISPR-associated protein Cas5d
MKLGCAVSPRSPDQRKTVSDPPVEVKVWGRLACFTRPEAKVERVSYSTMTPSAARGVLEAIYWKPEFAWRVREIWVLPYPEADGSQRGFQDVRSKHLSLMRNEVNRRAVAGTEGFTAAEERTQRHTLALRDVAYLIRADVFVRAGVAKHPASFRDQFRRRVDRGQCFHRPYLGCREFAADFAVSDGTETPLPWTEDLGLMLGEIEYHAQTSIPRFFPARLLNGVLHVPPELYERGAS